MQFNVVKILKISSPQQNDLRSTGWLEGLRCISISIYIYLVYVCKIPQLFCCFLTFPVVILHLGNSSKVLTEFRSEKQVASAR